MSKAAKIQKLDEVVINRIAAGEVIQRPANALKELIENSLDAKASNIQIVTKEGGLKLLQIQDNGTGIRKEDMDIVCERFTTSKLQKFEDLKSIATFGFRGEALASISHIALLTITTKTADEKCAYKASYIDSKLKAPPKSCAGNQGTTITIENVFYNVATRRKALSSPNEEFSKITDVVMKYAVHNPTVGFVLKKQGEVTPQVRTPHNSTKMNNIRILYGNPVSRELLEIELTDESYKFKMHALVTNPNYTSKRLVLLLFINNRLVESASIRKMIEEIYSIYLPKKTYPWCYVSLEINPQNIDVNVHPTKHEVKFLHEDSIIERVKFALDEKLAGNSASRTFYLQARLPNADITKETLKEVLPEYDKEYPDKLKKIHAREMIRTDSSDQKLDKFNFTINSAFKHGRNDSVDNSIGDQSKSESTMLNDRQERVEETENLRTDINNSESKNESSQLDDARNKTSSPWSAIVNDTCSSAPSQFTAPNIERVTTSSQIDNADDPYKAVDINDLLEILEDEFTENAEDESIKEKCVDEIADNARKRVYQYFGSKDIGGDKKTEVEIASAKEKSAGSPSKIENCKSNESVDKDKCSPTQGSATENTDEKAAREFKSYSVNNFRREVKLTSVLQLRKEVESNCHEGLREILSGLTFVGCIDQTSALVQSGVNLYLCNTKTLAEELFYEIMLYDFANYGVIKFSDAISLYDLAMLGLDTEEAGWTEDDGPKEELASSVKELLLEKADMMKEYFSIVIDKRGNLKSLPILLDKYFPHEAGLPMYVLRLATEVEWSSEQRCFRNICKETAKYYSQINPVHGEHDWRYVTEHVLYPAIKESLLPPKHFSHDSTVLQIASLPDLYKVFERC